jgi:hypothetical protein
MQEDRKSKSTLDIVAQVVPIIATLTAGAWAVFTYFHPATGVPRPIKPVEIAKILPTPDNATDIEPRDVQPAPGASASGSEAGGGTAMAAVRTFYDALHRGRGDEASMMVIAEKRASGPFSAMQLSNFYGSLREPIDLLDIMPAGDDEYRVHYRYTAARTTCDAWALVRTTINQDRYFIARIKALGGC